MNSNYTPAQSAIIAFNFMTLKFLESIIIFMTRFFIITVITLFSFQVSAQKVLVDIFIPSTVLIKYNSEGSASGVIVGDSSYMYLVTARHCFFNEVNKNLSLIDSLASLVYYTNDAFGGKSDTLQVNLSSALKQRDLLFDPVNDIAVLTIAKITGNTPSGKQIFNYTSSTTKVSKLAPGGITLDLCLDFKMVDVGEDCTIIGYPASLQIRGEHDYDFQRPLLRKGAIAGKDITRGSIIVDCPSYQGNSGGPVFATSINDKFNIGLVGVVSRAILLVEQLESSYYKTTVSINRVNSGYTVVVPIEFAKALMVIRRTFK